MSRYDLGQYLVTQGQETRRAFFIHAPAMGHKTALARRMRHMLGAYVLDLQAHFLERPDLSARIDRFRPGDLEKLLLGLDESEKIIVVDNVDFLLNTWSQPTLEQFVGMVESRLKSPDITDKTFVFILQSNSVILQQDMTNSLGQPRILPLSAFKAL